MKYWKWIKGRQQETDYEKLCLWSFRLWNWGFDAYILKYSPNTKLDWHKDPVEGGEHWRKNIKIQGWATFIRKENDVKKVYFKHNSPWFRPDIEEHMLQVYENGCMKLSFGFVKYYK